jgi:hypothetical protein
MNEEELKSRLAGITSGPWSTSKYAKKSVRYLEPPGPFNLDAATLDLSDVTADRDREEALSYLLAPHWIRSIRGDETWLRVGLDSALTSPMLLELAIENEYIDAKDSRTVARQILAPLLWSKAVQTYIIDYDYISVVLLAQRVGIELGRFSKLTLPPNNESGAAVFSAFLDYYLTFFEDRQIWRFLRLLDNYRSHNMSKRTLWRSLDRHSDADVSEPELEAAEGAVRFLEHIAAIERPAGETMRIPFALFYTYWLSKFFGYRLGKNGYKESEREHDWSTQIPALAKLAGTVLPDRADTVLVEQAQRLWQSARCALQNYACDFKR